MRTVIRAMVLPMLPWIAAPALVQAQAPTPLPLKREQPVVEWQGCARPDLPPTAAAPGARVEAERLAADANEAAILGDNETALSLLTQAARLDPRAERVAFLRARTLDLLGRQDQALMEYCRYAGLATEGAERADADERIAELVRARGAAVPLAAAEAHATGLRHHDAGLADDAAAAFDIAVSAAPAWAAAVYNRGLARLALGRDADAAADLRRYLELRPGADDFGAVLDLLGQLQAAPPAYNPSSALAAGLVIPGLGHFTTGRPGRGSLFLGAAAGMVAAGALVTTSNVECLAPPEGGRCPPDQVLRETNERPLLVPALVGAALTGVIGAIDAYRGARRSNRTEAPGRSGGGGFSVLPGGDVGARATDVTLFRLRF
ncbi:MAG TPA: DUF6677 family protein [Longimicrobiales bacterium]|nr:DUF6677 family protein [Longimicrobiales bacterium]